MKRLSIIVPMYNVALYVERCIRSLEEQDIPKEDYEIICINDGSPDNCREIIEGLQDEYCNIILINQENQGVSCARNNGIDKAYGTYLLFIDPDDYVDANSFHNILKDTDERKVQISFLGHTFLNENGTIRNRVFNEFNTERIYQGTEAYNMVRRDYPTDPDRMWAILFKTEFFNRYSLRYLHDMPYLEDGELIARILCFAERCIFDGRSFYQRTTRPGSATNSDLFKSEKATNGFLLAVRNLKKFQKEQNLNEKQRLFLNQPIAKFVLLSINSAIGWGLYNKFLKTVKNLKELQLKRVDLKGCDHPEILFYGKMYNLSPWLGAFALILYPRFERVIQLIIFRKRFSRK